MAEMFRVEKAILKTRNSVDVKLNAIHIDVSPEFVDLLIGNSQYRWERKTGKLIQRSDGEKL